MSSIYQQEKEKALCLIHDASENLLDLEFNLPPDYRLTMNERIKLKNIIWLISVSGFTGELISPFSIISKNYDY